MDRKLLHKFFEGTASMEEGMEIKTWMESSGENEHTFYKERKLFDALSIHNVLTDEQKLKLTVTRPKRIRMEWLKIASAIILTFAFSHLYQNYWESQKPIEMNTISVPAGQRANIILPDGTNVWLNARTTLQYPTEFNASQRTVILKGEAYFDVTRNEKKPFTVQTETYNIEVLGTQFDVEAYPGQESFETTLMHGSVKVSSQTNPEQSLTISPNQKVYLEEGKLRVAKVDDFNPYRWKEGLICFQNDSFQHIMKDFEKYYGLKIIINNQEVLKYDYTGKFRQADGVDYALRVLKKDIYFNYEKDNDQQIVYIN